MRHFLRACVVVTLVIFGALSAPACTSSRAASAEAPVEAPSSTPAAPVYTPGLGDIMTLVQNRHAKIFYAAQAGNWDLAQYEQHELDESLDEVVQFYPNFKGHDLTTIVPSVMGPAMTAVQDAVSHQDLGAFNRGFATLTQSCNQCHQTTAHSFIAIQVPADQQEFSNLKFTPAN